MCAQQVTYDEIELLKKGISLRRGSWSGVLVSAHTEATKCPLALMCYPSCFWWKDGRCTFPGEYKPRVKDIKGNIRWLAALQRKVVSLRISKVAEKRNQKFIEYFGNALLAATSCALLWFLGCIWVEGAHYIQEPNIIILAVETAAISAILGFAIHKLMNLIGK